MPSPQKSDGHNLVLGSLCIMLGLFPIARALHWIPPESGDDAPDWIIFLCGFIFEISGLMMLVGDKNKRLIDGLAAAFTAVMGATALWVGLLSPSESIGGGIPFIPHELNVLIARCLFSFGALISLLICKHAVMLALKGRDRA